MRDLLRVLVLMSLITSANAQLLTREEWSTYAYEEMSDWLRRLPGIDVVDYGVAGAPLLLRPWGRSPWSVGVTRDGIPWHRVSDGLYDSNLDLPEELDSLSVGLASDGRLGVLRMITRTLPADTPLTEISLREGYYGFGRVDFAHAQQVRPRMDIEGRGRLFWYDGLRFDISKSRFYRLQGRLTYRITSAWQGEVEYGGSNVDAQSPYIIRPLVNRIDRPQEFSEREFGTMRLRHSGARLDTEFGLHGRQDRVTRESYFGSQEQVWYGFADAEWVSGGAHLGTRISGEHVRAAFPGVGQLTQQTPKVDLRGRVHLADFELAGDGSLSTTQEEVDGEEIESFVSSGYHIRAATPSILTARIVSEFSGGRFPVPAFWRFAQYDLVNYPRLIDDAMADTSLHYSGTRSTLTEKPINWQVGFETRSRNWNASLYWSEHQGDAGQFAVVDSTVWVTNLLAVQSARGLSYQGKARLFGPFSFQSAGWVQFDPDDTQRAVENRSFSRLIFSRDFFKSPLHVDAYAAYEHIGTRRTVSEQGSHVLGPAHMLHIRFEGTIQGVTLIWGAENLTAQHYEYLPGYMLIRKEEYFGLRWTLRL